ATILGDRTTVDQCGAVSQGSLDISRGCQQVLLEIGVEAGRLEHGGSGAHLAASGFPGPSATIENRHGVMAEHLEGPVDAGCGAEFGGIGALRHDDDMVVIANAQLANQRGSGFDTGELTGYAVDFQAPAGRTIGGRNGAGDVRAVISGNIVDGIAYV